MAVNQVPDDTPDTGPTRKVFLLPGPLPAGLQRALSEWAAANGLDPAKVIGSDGVEVDLTSRVIRYNVLSEKGEPHAFLVDRYSVWKRRCCSPLLVEPLPQLREPPAGYEWPSAAAGQPSTGPADLSAAVRDLADGGCYSWPVEHTQAVPADALVDRRLTAAELAAARRQRDDAMSHASDDVLARLAALRALYAELVNGPPINGDWLFGELGRLTWGAGIELAAAKLRIADPDTALWRAIDRLAGLLGMTWTVDDHGAAVLAAAADRLTPQPATYDWERYRRTCDPGAPLDGLGDLCAFLGGTWAQDTNPGSGSFIAGLLKLIAKADPDRLARLEAGFPREVLAWRVWMGMSPAPTAAQLAAELTGRQHPDRPADGGAS